MAHAVVRLDNVQGTHDGTKLRSLKYYKSNAATAIDNGCVVKLSDLEAMAGGEFEREVWKAGDLAAGDKANIVLVASPEVMYDEHLHNLSDFYNEAGEIARGYILCAHDIFSVTAEALSGSPAKGSFLEAMAGPKLKVASAETNAVAKIIQVEKVDSLTFYVIEVM